MSFQAEVKRLRQADADGENSNGMTQLVNVIAVGSLGLFIGTPVTPAAALGTALGRLERRIRGSVEWEARA